MRTRDLPPRLAAVGVCALLALCNACGSGSTNADAGADAGTDATGDASPSRISVGASTGSVTLDDSDFSVTGRGSTIVGAFTVTHGAGTIELNGATVPLAVYERQPFEAAGYTLYQAIAVEPERLWVLWFYCDVSTNELDGVYYEATDGTPVLFERGTGTCVDTRQTSAVSVHLPAFAFEPPPVIDGYTVSGANVSIAPGVPGAVRLGGTNLTVYAFNTVNCRQDCGTPGWTELHALLWDPDRRRACFGIFYLSESDHAHVQLAWSITLPELRDLANGVRLDATWSSQ